MLKGLNKNDTQVTPYVATKDWQLSNIDNSDLILSETGNTIIYENVVLTSTEVFPSNIDCDIAKEDQSNDLAIYREGLKVTGIFYPDIDPLNTDGTYKRMVYTQIKTTFYNNYRDPNKMWGLEKIDFDSSNTKKFLSDKIKIFNIPTDIMGEKIIEGTLEILDNSMDDLHSITDDGQNNLFAGTNLFSRKQELGDFQNTFFSGSSQACINYFDYNIPKSPYALTSSIIGIPPTASIVWLDAPANGFIVERAFLIDSEVTSSFVPLLFTGPDITCSYDTNISYGEVYYYRVYAFNQWGTSSFSNIGTVNLI
jgi:hypothetical protein